MKHLFSSLAVAASMLASHPASAESGPRHATSQQVQDILSENHTNTAETLRHMHSVVASYDDKCPSQEESFDDFGYPTKTYLTYIEGIPEITKKQHIEIAQLQNKLKGVKTPEERSYWAYILLGVVGAAIAAALLARGKISRREYDELCRAYVQADIENAALKRENSDLQNIVDEYKRGAEKPAREFRGRIVDAEIVEEDTRTEAIIGESDHSDDTPPRGDESGSPSPEDAEGAKGYPEIKREWIQAGGESPEVRRIRTLIGPFQRADDSTRASAENISPSNNTPQNENGDNHRSALESSIQRNRIRSTLESLGDGDRVTITTNDGQKFRFNIAVATFGVPNNVYTLSDSDEGWTSLMVSADGKSVEVTDNQDQILAESLGNISSVEADPLPLPDNLRELDLNDLKTLLAQKQAYGEALNNERPEGDVTNRLRQELSAQIRTIEAAITTKQP